MNESIRIDGRIQWQKEQQPENQEKRKSVCISC